MIKFSFLVSSIQLNFKAARSAAKHFAILLFSLKFSQIRILIRSHLDSVKNISEVK